ncbi:MAG: response regulator [Woeseiaceae bacterium]|nr:response regulator [Woeseiaceae bacterium]
MQGKEIGEPAPGSRRVLIVDDDRDFAESTKDALELSGYEAAVALDGPAATAAVHSFRPAVVLIDVRLGKNSGTDLIAELFKVDPGLICVMMSAYTSAESTIESLKQGAYDYLRKPFHQEDLFATLRRCFQQLQLQMEKLAAEGALRKRNEQLRRTNDRMRSMVARLRKITACTDIQSMCQTTIEQICHDFEAQGGSIYLLEDDQLVRAAEYGPSHAPNAIPSPSGTDTVFGVTLDSGEPLLVNNVPKNGDVTTSGWDGYAGESALAFPLVQADGDIIGLASTHSGKNRDFTEQDREIGQIALSFAAEKMSELDATSRHARLQAEFQQAQKMESLGQLAGGVAHDFNNILTSIIGYTDLAIDQVGDGDAIAAEYIHEIGRAGERASQLIAKMLAFSRMSPLESATTEIQPIIDEVIGLIRSTLPASIQLHTHFADESTVAVIDPVQLHQIVLNLCVNARDATDGVGNIEIRTEPETHHAGTCSSCGASFDGQFSAITIRDDGAGMAPDVLQRAFEPFYTTKEVGKGTGMGLSLVHGVLHDCGGHIMVESEPGEGTQFTLLFPSAEETAQGSHNGQQRLDRSQHESLSGHYLVVDDDESIAALIGEHLESAGATVSVVTRGADALDILRDATRPIDLMLTDQTMPGITGAQLIQSANELRPEMATILMTGNQDESLQSLRETLGDSILISKPFKLSNLSALIRLYSQNREQNQA